MRQVTLKVGEPFILDLESNPSTGYRWIVTASDGLRIEEGFVAPEDEDVVGAPGKQTFAISADAEGEYVFEVQYRRPDDEAAVDGRMMEITVTSA